MEPFVSKKSLFELPVFTVFTKYMLIFVEFSLVGWIYEVTLAFIYGYDFVNRGFLFGPFLPIYGFGGLLLYIALRGFMGKKITLLKVPITGILVFLAIVAIATTIELVAGLFIDQLLPARLWDYTHYNFNFRGIIALNPSMRFGIGGIVMLYILLPFFTFLTNKIPQKAKTVTALLLLLLLITDFTLTLAGKKS